MSLYAVGDVQGCLRPLEALLELVGFDAARDRLWFCGDLVNRGPESLETLRYVRRLPALSVLGNHDLHLLAVAYAGARLRRGDTLAPILAAPDREELLTWLRSCPLFHYDAKLGWGIVHAGLPPQWDLAKAQALAAEAEQVLRGEGAVDFLRQMYGNEPERWDDGLKGLPRLRAIVNGLTRLRYCTADGRMDMRETGPPGTQPPQLLPWFGLPEHRAHDLRLVFGHWASLGAGRFGKTISLDGGCVWGRCLTAVRLEPAPLAFYRVPC